MLREKAVITNEHVLAINICLYAKAIDCVERFCWTQSQTTCFCILYNCKANRVFRKLFYTCDQRARLIVRNTLETFGYPSDFTQKFSEEIKKVTVGESRTFAGARGFMESHGVEVIDLDLPECVAMMEEFIADEPDLWTEDIGE